MTRLCNHLGTSCVAIRIAAITIILALTPTTDATATTTQPTLNIPTLQGNVTGAINNGVAYFLGIPFTQPPVGPLRWKTPVTQFPTWTSDYDATFYRSICIQPSPTGLLGDEDCLYVNVYTPYPMPTTPLPVYVWIHGGGYIGGAAMDLPGDAFVRTSQDIIFVSIAYRLGPWGWFTHEALSNERGAGNVATSGLFGLEDQRQALKWVQANIAAYGGNPKNVTLGGESAGADSTCLHIVSPLSAGLFQRAIIESGGCDQIHQTLPEAEAIGKNISNAYGALAGLSDCSGNAGPAAQLTCFRSNLLTNDIIRQTAINLGSFAYFQPTGLVPHVDGYNVPDFPSNVLLNQTFNKVDLLVGSNTAEFGLFLPPIAQYPQIPTPTATTVRIYAYTLSGGDLTITKFYSNGTTSGAFPNEFIAMESLLSKYNFQCPLLRLGSAMTKVGNKVYSYMFNYTSVFGASYVSISQGAIHGSELNYVFDNAKGVENPMENHTGIAANTSLPWNQTSDQHTSESMRNYWIKFIESGNVNAAGTPPGLPGNVQAPTWPLFTATNTDSLVFQFDGTVFPTTNLYKTECDLWARTIHPRTPYQPRIIPVGPATSSSSTGGTVVGSSSGSSSGSDSGSSGSGSSGSPNVPSSSSSTGINKNGGIASPSTGFNFWLLFITCLFFILVIDDQIILA